MSDFPNVTLNDGITMPQIGLGVWKAENGDETVNAVRSALETGYRLIDTAAVYRNEESVGQAIKEASVQRKDIFLTTKLWNSDQGSTNVRPALETSLTKLGLDYVDLYLIHWPTPERQLFLESWHELEKLKAEGLIRSIGVSNFRIEDLEVLKSESSTIPSVNQIELHPLFQQRELREYANATGIAIESWSPIGGSKGSLLDDERLAEIGQSHGKTVAQVIIRWHIQSGLIVIPKSVHTERIKENFDVFDFELSNSDMEEINAMDAGMRGGPDPGSMNNH